MKIPATFTLALLLSTTAIAGGGPSVTRPAGTTISPFGTTMKTAGVMPVMLSELQMPGTTLILVTGRNVNVGTVRGSVITLPAGMEPATSVVVSSGGVQRRYSLRSPILPGVTTPIREIRLLPVAPVVLLPIQAPTPAPRPVTPTPAPVRPPAPTPVRPSPVQPTPVQPAPVTPAPAPGQPDPVQPAPPEGGNDKVSICHRTGSDSNPYNLITVSTNALDAHRAHGDLVPAPAEGCPAGTPPGNGNGGTPPGNGGK